MLSKPTENLDLYFFRQPCQQLPAKVIYVPECDSILLVARLVSADRAKRASMSIVSSGGARASAREPDFVSLPDL
jgi:hypothetical protein